MPNLNKIKINIFLLSLIFTQAVFAAFNSHYEIKGDDIYNLTVQDVHFMVTQHSFCKFD